MGTGMLCNEMHGSMIYETKLLCLNVACPASRMSVHWQDSNIIVKSVDQSLNSCESKVQSRVQGPGFVNTQF